MLTHDAVLVSLSESKLARRRYDKEASESVAEEFNATEDAGRFNKLIIESKGTKLGQIYGLMGVMKSYHNARTLPWGRGVQVLPATKLDDYMAFYRDIVRQIEMLMPDAIEDLPKIKAASEKRLGKMFKDHEFPTDEDVRSKFSIGVKIWPIPTSNDIRIQGLSDETEESLKETIEEQINDSMTGMVKAAWQIMHDAVDKFISTMSDGDKKVTQPLIEGLEKMIESMEDLNITKDPEIEGLRQEIKELVRYEAKDHRDFPSIRKETTKEAKAILAKMDSYI